MPSLYLHPPLVLISVVLKNKCWKHPLVIFSCWGPELTPIVRAPAERPALLFNCSFIFQRMLDASSIFHDIVYSWELAEPLWEWFSAVWIGKGKQSELAADERQSFFWRSWQQRERGFYQNSVGSSRLLIEGSFILGRSNLKKIKCPVHRCIFDMN